MTPGEAFMQHPVMFTLMGILFLMGLIGFVLVAINAAVGA